VKPYSLSDIATYAAGVGPNYQYLFNYKNESWDTKAESLFIQEAHSLGLGVHPYTMQDDMLKFMSNPIDEHILYLNKGVDGIFTEFPHTTYITYTNNFASGKFT